MAGLDGARRRECLRNPWYWGIIDGVEGQAFMWKFNERVTSKAWRTSVYKTADIWLSYIKIMCENNIPGYECLVVQWRLSFSFIIIQWLSNNFPSIWCSYLPLGKSASSFFHRTVGWGSPWTWQRNSTASSSSTTWLIGLLRNAGRS